MPTSSTVLVTGATGYIAKHCVIQLLNAGYKVRGTGRNPSKITALADELRPSLEDPATINALTLVEANLLENDGWEAAAADCTYVLHVASPFPSEVPKDENELLTPAREGTLRVLKAAKQAGVKRLVLTSSMASIMMGHPQDTAIDETSWTNVASAQVGAYERSKTLAEKAAWEYLAEQNDPFELVSINPALVLGPLLSSTYGTSGEVLRKLFERDFPAVPDLRFPVVDVRDVASVQVAALTNPNVAGERLALFSGVHSLREIASILSENFGSQGYKIPTKSLPGLLVRFMALFDPTVKLALTTLGREYRIDNSKTATLTGWKPRQLETMVVDMGQSMIDHKIVEPS